MILNASRGTPQALRLFLLFLPGWWGTGCALISRAEDPAPDTTYLAYQAARGGFVLETEGPVKVREEEVRIAETLFRRWTFEETSGERRCEWGYYEPERSRLPLGEPRALLRRVAATTWPTAEEVEAPEASAPDQAHVLYVILHEGGVPFEGRVQVAHGRYYFFAHAAGRDCAWERLRLLPALYDPATSAQRAALLEALAGACEAAAADGCFALAEAALLGWFGVHDPARIAGWFREACELGHPFGCTGLGWWLLESGSDREKRRARQLLETGCGADNGVACLILALAYQDGAFGRRDLARAAEYLERSAALGTWSLNRPPPEVSDILIVLCDRGRMAFCPEVRAGY